MKISLGQAKILNKLLGVRISEFKNGHTKLHAKKLGPLASRLGVELSSGKTYATKDGRLLCLFCVGIDLGLAVEFVGANHVCLYLAPHSLILSSLGTDLTLISNQWYEVIDGKVLHSRKRQPPTHRPHGGASDKEVSG